VQKDLFVSPSLGFTFVQKTFAAAKVVKIIDICKKSGVFYKKNMQFILTCNGLAMDAERMLNVC
jgi:hypothetical protein